MTCRAISKCRVCGSETLEEVLSFGAQALGGQFPSREEPDPPAYPLALGRCVDGCGLVQLLHTVDPGEMFRNYYYRSGVSLTMRTHLQNVADTAVSLLKRNPGKVLDIGGNDGTLVGHLNGLYAADCVVVDPCQTFAVRPVMARQHKDFYPSDAVRGEKFDLIFSIACLYAVDDPVTFAKAVHDNLADDGLWVIEVGYLPKMLSRVGYDSICHEHLAYYGVSSLDSVLGRAGFMILHASNNDMNGGTLRVVAYKTKHERPAHATGGLSVDRSYLLLLPRP